MLGLMFFCIVLVGPRPSAHDGCGEGLHKTTHSRRGWDLQEAVGGGEQQGVGGEGRGGFTVVSAGRAKGNYLWLITRGCWAVGEVSQKVSPGVWLFCGEGRWGCRALVVGMCLRRCVHRQCPGCLKELASWDIRILETSKHQKTECGKCDW